MLKKIFGSSKENNKSSEISEIGLPTNVVRGIHVSKNSETGDLVGLPKQWQKLLKNLITEDERTENPDAGLYKISIIFIINVYIHTCMSCPR